jgi:predicted metal-dependent phosphoesterase TrpH
LRRFKADLHIHSCLSPCCDLDMSPRAIVERSLERELDLIALCDHNSAENVGAAMRAGAKRGLQVLPGLEISSQEEVHTLAIFDDEAQALRMQTLVYAHLKGTNRPELFGDQVVANEFDEVEGFNDRRLIGAAQLGLHEVVKAVHRLGGISIASHVDRPSFSVLSQLGFIPDDLELDGVEVSPRTDVRSARTAIPGIGSRTVVAFSDAHFLTDIAGATTLFHLEAPTVDELRLALASQAGRGVTFP